MMSKVLCFAIADLDYLDIIPLEPSSIDKESLNKLISEIKNRVNNLFNFDDCN